MARGRDDADDGRPPLKRMAVFQCFGDRNRFGQHEAMGAKIINMPALLRVVPEVGHLVEIIPLGGGDDQAGPGGGQERRPAGLIAVMVRECKLFDAADADRAKRIAYGPIAAVDQ